MRGGGYIEAFGDRFLANAMHIGASRFLFEPLQCVQGTRSDRVLKIQRAVSNGQSGFNCAADATGTKVAAPRYVKTKLNLLVALVLGLLAPLALPTDGAVEAIVCAVDWIGGSRIAEFAAAANAFAIVP